MMLLLSRCKTAKPPGDRARDRPPNTHSPSRQAPTFRRAPGTRRPPSAPSRARLFFAPAEQNGGARVMADIPLRKDIRFWLSFLLSVLAIWYTWSQNQTNSDLGSIFFAEPTVVAQGCGSSETFQLIGTGWLADQTVD